MAGVVDNGRIRLEPVHRFTNGMVERDGHLRWDIIGLHEQVRLGLARLPDAVSVGIDTWGVDYGLLDDDGMLLADPVAYRDGRTDGCVERVSALVPPEELYSITGTQLLSFNTIYQLAAEADGPLWDRAARVVMLPDLLAYWLTGRLGSELTIASTTGLLDVRVGQWSGSLLERLGVPASMLDEVEPPGRVRGPLWPAGAAAGPGGSRRSGASSPLGASGASGRSTSTTTVVTAVASHDTASAVAAVPAVTDRFAYISSGTWSLVGLELDRPVVSEAARTANFTNEIGIDGRVRFLRNVGGLWVLQECIREWTGRGDRRLEPLLAAAGRLPGGGATFDVDSPGFVAPGDMPRRVSEAVGSRLSRIETVRCILDSLASAYARTVGDACRLTGMAVDVVHIVGGGSRNRLLCQLTADAVGVAVLAGPAEATALGNVIVQARAHRFLPGTLEAVRAGLAASEGLERYEPS